MLGGWIKGIYVLLGSYSVANNAVGVFSIQYIYYIYIYLGGKFFLFFKFGSSTVQATLCLVPLNPTLCMLYYPHSSIYTKLITYNYDL